MINRKFGVFNPLTGVYDLLDTFEEAEEAFARIWLDQILEFSRRMPIAIVETNELGHEIWKNSDQVTVTPGEIAGRTKTMLNTAYKWLDDDTVQ